MSFKGLLQEGSQAMLPPGLLGDMDPQTQKYLTNRIAMGGMADLATAFGQGLDKYYGVASSGGPTNYAQQSMDQIPGLLEQQQAQQRLAANQQALGQYAQEGELPAHLQALLANNPELMEHFFKERYTGRTIAPGGVLKMQGQPDYQAPNRPQTVGTDLVDPNTGRLIHRAPPNPGVNVNVGTGAAEFGPIPAGHVLRRGMDGSAWMEPLEGSPEARDIEADRVAQEMRQSQTSRAGGTVVQDVNRALGVLEDTGFFGAGAGAHLGRRFSESDAATVDQLIKSIESNIGFDQLSQMRQASTTGGALGNVTELQLQQLQSVMGRMELTGRPEVLQDNLKRVHNIYMDIVHGTPEQIQAIARERGIPEEQIAPMLFRHQLSFDDFGRPQQGRASPAPSAAPAPQIRHWNPQTGRLE